MLANLCYVWELIRTGLISFRDTNFNLVRFDSLGLALGAGFFIVMALFYKLLWGRNKFSHVGSGHRIPKKYHQGKLSKLVFLVPKIFLGGSVFFVLVSLANPYLPKTVTEKLIESRERIDLIDVSSSKGWEFEHTGKSAGQLGREAFLKFLNMRRGQNDRVSLWLFASEPYIREDFIIDDDVYIMEAEDAPYVIVDSNNPSFPENFYFPEEGGANNYNVHIVAPRDRIQFVPEEGGTNLNLALDAIIQYFDREGNKKVKHKALLIETDAAVEADAEKQLRELQKRNVKVYLLHIKPNELGESEWGNLNGIANAKLLQKRVKEFGGKVFDVRDKNSIDDAYREINMLEKVPVLMVRHSFKIFIYQRPLIVAIVLMFLAMGSGLLTDRYGENP
jgi:hypothetical protein